MAFAAEEKAMTAEAASASKVDRRNCIEPPNKQEVIVENQSRQGGGLLDGAAQTGAVTVSGPVRAAVDTPIASASKRALKKQETSALSGLL